MITQPFYQVITDRVRNGQNSNLVENETKVVLESIST